MRSLWTPPESSIDPRSPVYCPLVLPLLHVVPNVICRCIMGLFEALFVAFVLVAMLSLLFVGWKTPEIVVSTESFVLLVFREHFGVQRLNRSLNGGKTPGVDHSSMPNLQSVMRQHGLPRASMNMFTDVHASFF